MKADDVIEVDSPLFGKYGETWGHLSRVREYDSQNRELSALEKILDKDGVYTGSLFGGAIGIRVPSRFVSFTFTIPEGMSKDEFIKTFHSICSNTITNGDEKEYKVAYSLREAEPKAEEELFYYKR